MSKTIFLSLVSLCFFLLAIPLIATEPEGVPPLKIVYFIPAGMEPVPDCQERLGRVMKYVQDFYRHGMEANGYGSKTFALEWDAPGKLKLYTVSGKKKQEEYGRNDAFPIRNEVRDALKEKYGIEANEELLVIFQLLLKWDGGKAIELGPYVGSGSSLSGTAWMFDDPLLDPELLSSQEPGGYYYRPCSLGEFNSHYLGGVAHELGHAFSLPHEAELNTDKKERGTSLMGAGNHTFGQEKRNEGIGTFLTAASALRLSKVRAFAGDLPGSRERAYWNIEELTAAEKVINKEKGFILSGKVSATPKLAGIIVYNDNKNIPSDYDAKTWTQKVDADGRFQFEIDELLSVPYQLRLVGVHKNGATNLLSVDYQVTDHQIDLSPLNIAIPLHQLKALFRVGNGNEIDAIAKKYPENEEIQRKAKHLTTLLKSTKTVDVAKLAPNILETDLTWADFEEAKVGWSNFHRGHVPENVFIQINNIFFESGLFAHAPSRYKIDLSGSWKTLDFGFGLQDGHDGEVTFIVRGDGKELFRSESVTDHQERRNTVSVENVKVLELIVEPSPSGNSGAWGIWTTPLLKR